MLRENNRRAGSSGRPNRLDSREALGTRWQQLKQARVCGWDEFMLYPTLALPEGPTYMNYVEDVGIVTRTLGY